MSLPTVLRYQWHALLLLSIACDLFLNLWGYFLFDLDEGAFSEATREMLASGYFAATYLDGEPRYDKPILSDWFQAISIQFFGLNEFAVRLPSAIAATLWIVVVIRFFLQQVRQRQALFAGLILVNFFSSITSEISSSIRLSQRSSKRFTLIESNSKQLPSQDRASDN